jgi:hypothetical protein
VEVVVDEKAPENEPERATVEDRLRKPPNFCQTDGTSSSPSSKPPFRIEPAGVGTAVAVGPVVGLDADVGIGEGACTVGVGVLVGEAGGPTKLRSSTQAVTGADAVSSTRRRAEWAQSGAMRSPVLIHV